MRGSKKLSGFSAYPISIPQMGCPELTLEHTMSMAIYTLQMEPSCAW